METLWDLDAEIVVWLNQWAARSDVLHLANRLIVSDYLMPAAIGLCLMAAWFAGKGPESRDALQRGVLRALMSVGFASLVVLILNEHYYRDRPFVEHELTVLFYRPTDSSFPAHPAAVGFAMASGMWQASRKLASLLYLLAGLWCLSRIVAGVFYLSDVMAGAAIAMIMSYLLGLALRRIEPVPTMVLRGARTLHLA